MQEEKYKQLNSFAVTLLIFLSRKVFEGELHFKHIFTYGFENAVVQLINQFQYFFVSQIFE